MALEEDIASILKHKKVYVGVDIMILCCAEPSKYIANSLNAGSGLVRHHKCPGFDKNRETVLNHRISKLLINFDAQGRMMMDGYSHYSLIEDRSGIEFYGPSDSRIEGAVQIGFHPTNGIAMIGVPGGALSLSPGLSGQGSFVKATIGGMLIYEDRALMRSKLVKLERYPTDVVVREKGCTHMLPGLQRGPFSKSQTDQAWMAGIDELAGYVSMLEADHKIRLQRTAVDYIRF
ncbi:hypothetical protein JW968_04615 [Candidatus Woesearchaeota archaeon]|nr:hypothetical protein [Candidatus Woesearchaeota archaeon]